MNMKCWICGKDAVGTLSYIYRYGVTERAEPSKYFRCYCEECMKETKDLRDYEDAEYVRLKKRQMFNTAIDNLESQKVDMYKLKPAIDKVEEYVGNHPDKFDSSYEILTAIVFISQGIQFQMQKKILRYQVDFYIPSHKLIVEIDGERHKNRKSFDNERDEKIIDEVGYDWNIVRIKTEDLDKNCMKLIKAIDNVLKYRATGKINWRDI